LLDDLHLLFKCDALGVPNNPNPWTENSQQCDYLSVHVDGSPSMLKEKNIHAHCLTISPTLVPLDTCTRTSVQLLTSNPILCRRKP